MLSFESVPGCRTKFDVLGPTDADRVSVKSGLKPGDRWCLCAPRWQEAFEAGQAPRVVLRATQESALEYCALADLKRHAIDLS